MLKILYLISMIAVVVAYNIPTIGANGLNVYLGKVVGLLIFSGALLGLAVKHLLDLKKQRNEAEAVSQTLDKKKTPNEAKERIWCFLAIVIFSFLIVLDFFQIRSYMKDVNTEPVQAELVACQIGSSRARKSFITHYSLNGWSGRTRFSFDISGLPKNEIDRMRYSTGVFHVTFYPNTKVLVDYSFIYNPEGEPRIGSSTETYYQSYLTGNMAQQIIDGTYNQGPWSANVVLTDTSAGSGDGTTGDNAAGINMLDTYMQENMGDIAVIQAQIAAASEMDTMVLVEEINQAGTLPFTLLEKMPEPASYSALAREEDALASGDGTSYMNYYPHQDGEYVRYKVIFSSDAYSLYGIKVGDDVEQAKEILQDKGYYYDSTFTGDDIYHRGPEGSQVYNFFAGDVNVMLYADGETKEILEIKVFVSERKNSISVFY